MTAILKPFLPHLAIAAGLIISGLWFSHVRYTAGVEFASAQCQANLTKAAEQGRADVERVRAEQREKNERDKQEQERKFQSAREADNQRLNEMHIQTQTWQRRYQQALSNSSECSAWSQQVVACPLK